VSAPAAKLKALPDSDGLARAFDDLTPRPPGVTALFPENLALRLTQRAIIKNAVPAGGLGQLIGAPGSGKTAVAVDMGCHVACGIAYRGNRVRQGAVAYYAIEACGSVVNRVIAWATVHGVDHNTIPIVIFHGAMDLRVEGSVLQALKEMQAAEQRLGEPFVLVAFDTQSAVTPGADENSHRDMSLAIANAARFSERGATTLLIQHTGKDQERGARGHSSQLAAMDFLHEVRDFQIHCRKSRDTAIGEPIAFRLQGVELGKDEDGDPITAVVAMEAEPHATPRGSPPRLSDGSKTALRVLRQILKDEGVEDADTGARIVPLARWRAAHQDRYGGASGDKESRDAERQAWRRALQQLQAARIVTVQGDSVTSQDRKPKTNA
jgi:hypothetical protein